MTVAAYIKRFGWHDSNDNRFKTKRTMMTCTILFYRENELSNLDETEFDIMSFNVFDLESLWETFCFENEFDMSDIIYISCREYEDVS